MWNWKDGWCEWEGPGVPNSSNFTEKIESYPYRIVVARDTNLVWNLLLARDHRLWNERGGFPEKSMSVLLLFAST